MLGEHFETLSGNRASVEGLTGDRQLAASTSYAWREAVYFDG
jgi:hypothetical protein